MQHIIFRFNCSCRFYFYLVFSWGFYNFNFTLASSNDLAWASNCILLLPHSDLSGSRGGYFLFRVSEAFLSLLLCALSIRIQIPSERPVWYFLLGFSTKQRTSNITEWIECLWRSAQTFFLRVLSQDIDGLAPLRVPLGRGQAKTMRGYQVSYRHWTEERGMKILVSGVHMK